MRRISILLIALSAVMLPCLAQEILLPEIDIECGSSAMRAFSERKSTRSFSAKDLNDHDLGQILWCGMGSNRKDKLTAPSCRNLQEIRLYVFTKEGIWQYLPKTHSLRHVAEGDHRGLVASGQEFVNDAPVSLVMVADMGKFPEINENSKMMASVDAGIVSQNISIGCAALGLATVPRATMEKAAIRELLGLSEDFIPIMNNPIGWPQ